VDIIISIVQASNQEHMSSKKSSQGLNYFS